MYLRTVLLQTFPAMMVGATVDGLERLGMLREARSIHWIC